MAEENRNVSIVADGIKRVSSAKMGSLEVVLDFYTSEAAVRAAVAFLDQIARNPKMLPEMENASYAYPERVMAYDDLKARLIKILRDKYGCEVVEQKKASEIKEREFATTHSGAA